MGFKLICVHPYYDRELKTNIERGQEITDPATVAKLQEDRDHHFVRVAMPGNGNGDKH